MKPFLSLSFYRGKTDDEKVPLMLLVTLIITTACSEEVKNAAAGSIPTE